MSVSTGAVRRQDSYGLVRAQPFAAANDDTITAPEIALYFDIVAAGDTCLHIETSRDIFGIDLDTEGRVVVQRRGRPGAAGCASVEPACSAVVVWIATAPSVRP